MNLRNENEQGLFSLAPSRQKSQRTMLEQLLAGDWSQQDVVAFENVLKCPFGDAVPVIISKNISEQSLRMAEESIGKETKGIWVVPYEKEEWKNLASEQFLFIKREVER